MPEPPGDLKLERVAEFLEVQYEDWDRIFGNKVPYDTYSMLFCMLISKSSVQLSDVELFFAKMKHKDTQLRYLERVRDFGLISYTHEKDKRFKRIHPTDLLQTKMTQFLQGVGVKILAVASDL